MIRGTNGVRVLAALIGVLFLARVAFVLRVPDLDGDAYAHFEIARAVAAAPHDLGPHWVWLPGYHFYVAVLQGLGASFVHVRLLNAAAQALGPLLVYAYARMRHPHGVASLAGSCFAVCSVPNLVGTSALGEVSFTLLVLASAILVDAAERSIRCSFGAGVLLAAACSMRYEAWVVAAALALGLAVRVVVRRAIPWRQLPLAAIPCAAVATYVVFRRVVDREWLWFVHETLRFTNMQRDVLAASRVFEAFWFPVILPAKLFGPAVVLVPIGAFAKAARTRRERPSAIVPAAIATFLVVVFLGNSMLGLARYFSVLAPFACVLVARGTLAVGRLVAARHAAALATAVLVALFVPTIVAMRGSARVALEHAPELRAREAIVDGASSVDARGRTLDARSW